MDSIQLIDELFRAVNAHRFGQDRTNNHFKICAHKTSVTVSSPSHPNNHFRVNEYCSIAATCLHKPCTEVCLVLPYCKAHAKELLHLRVGQSDHGEGLFADKPGATDGSIVFQRNSYVAPYIGMMMTKKQCEELYDDGPHNCPYAVDVDTVYVDNRQITLGSTDAYVVDAILCMSYGAKANTTTKKTAINTAIHPAGVGQHPRLLAKIDIRQGEEILCLYKDNKYNKEYFITFTERWLREEYWYQFNNDNKKLPDIRTFFRTAATVAVTTDVKCKQHLVPVGSITNLVRKSFFADTPPELRINSSFCYTDTDVANILYLRLEEEKRRYPGLLDHVFALPVVASGNVYEKVYNTKYRPCPDLFASIGTAPSHANQRQRLLIPYGHDDHIIGMAVDLLDGQCISISIVDSSGVIKDNIKSKRAIEEAAEKLGFDMNSTPTVNWYAGLLQRGHTCTLYTIENLILAAHTKLSVYTTRFRNPLLLRYHHLKTLWDARRQYQSLPGDTGQMDIFNHFYARQVRGTPDSENVFQWDALSSFNNKVYSYDDVLADDNIWDQRAPSRLHNTSLANLFVESLDYDYIFTRVSSAFTKVQGFMNPSIHTIRTWLLKMQQADKTTSDITSRQHINGSKAWRAPYLICSFMQVYDQENGALILKSIAQNPQDYDRLLKDQNFLYSYARAVERVLTCTPSAAIFYDSEARFSSFLTKHGLPTDDPQEHYNYTTRVCPGRRLTTDTNTQDPLIPGEAKRPFVISDDEP